MEEEEELEAEYIYLLTGDASKVSRNTKSEWYFKHLYKVIKVPKLDHPVSEIFYWF